MLASVVGWLLVALLAHLALGFVFALLFVTRWVGRVDPDAVDGSPGFRLAIFPGAVALWPLLALRLVAGAEALPVERTPHRSAARGEG